MGLEDHGEDVFREAAQGRFILNFYGPLGTGNRGMIACATCLD